MRSLICVAIACVACNGCGRHPVPLGPATATPPIADVTVRRDWQKWTVAYQFHRDAPVWMLIESALTRNGQPWQPLSWTLDTPGLRLERRGSHEVLASNDGANIPRVVRLRFTPFADGLQAAYESARIFTNGSVALFTDQFDVVPLGSLAEADAIPMDLGGTRFGTGPTRVTFRDASGPVLLQGQRHDPAVAIRARSYVLFGSLAQRDTDQFVSAIDPALPRWLRDELEQFTPRLLDLYITQFGRGLESRFTLMVSWAGPTASRRSMDGDTLPGLLMMAFEGDGVASFSPEVRSLARGFIAHESAHFWLGQQLRYERVRDMWITEGGADLLAVRALASSDASYRATETLQQEVDDCVRLSTGKPIATAAERQEQRAFYACGATFGMVAEAVASRTGGDFFTFVRALLQAHQQDGIVTTRDWLDLLSAQSGDSSLATDMLTMIDAASSDPAARLSSMFSRVGIKHERQNTSIVLTP